MNWYLVLLVLYVLLLCYYWWSSRQHEPKLNLWTRINSSNSLLQSNQQSCKDHTDCPPDHLCHQGECIPKALRGGSCNPTTGDWVIEKDKRGKKIATCVCSHPHLVTQKFKGGNCDVDVACAPHGKIANWSTLDACICNEGYVPVPGQLKCRRLTAVENQQRVKPPCDPDEDEFRNAVHYDYKQYLAYHRDKKCLKRPCEFDVLTGKSFSKSSNSYHPEMGCLCDPTLGRFGVRLDSNFSTLNHYNGCASIFVNDEGPAEVDVEVHAYFYLLDNTNDSKPVVSFLVFKNLNPDDVNPIFRETVVDSGGMLVLEQDWPHDYMQYVLAGSKPYVVHSRECTETAFWFSCDEWVMKDNAMKDCRDIGQGIHDTYERINAYWLLYAYPVCHIDKDDTKIDKIYRGKYVVNPYHALYTDYPELLRSNSLVMKKDKTQDHWVIDFGKAYNVEYLMRNSAQVPDVWDEKAVKFVEKSLNPFEGRSMPIPSRFITGHGMPW